MPCDFRHWPAFCPAPSEDDLPSVSVLWEWWTVVSTNKDRFWRSTVTIFNMGRYISPEHSNTKWHYREIMNSEWAPSVSATHSRENWQKLLSCKPSAWVHSVCSTSRFPKPTYKHIYNWHCSKACFNSPTRRLHHIPHEMEGLAGEATAPT